MAAWLRDFIVARFNDVLGETLASVFDLASRYDELGAPAELVVAVKVEQED